MHRCHGWQKWMLGIVLYSMLGMSGEASEFCARGKADLIQEFLNPEARMGFKNSGGIGNGGVCWWHSRLQRSAVYLSRFNPAKPKPSYEEARALIRDLIFFSQVVEIPGYTNFAAFSEDFRELIQVELNHWQLRDGFIAQEWIRGLKGKSQLPAPELKARLDKIYQGFLVSRPGLWLMAQMPGITSHALLLIGMKPVEQGYVLNVIDSNRPLETRVLQYQKGDEAMQLGNDHFVPYMGFQNDQRLIDGTLRNYCQASL